MGKATSLSRVWLRAVIFGDQTQVCLQWGISATVYLSCAGALTFSFGSGSVLPQDDGRYMYRITWIWICTWIGVNGGELKILVCGSQRICSLLGLKEGQFLHRSCRASEGGCRRADVFIYINVWPWLCLHTPLALLAQQTCAFGTMVSILAVQPVQASQLHKSQQHNLSQKPSPVLLFIWFSTFFPGS